MEKNMPLVVLYKSYNLYRSMLSTQKKRENFQFREYLELLDFSEQEIKDIIRDLCLSLNLPGFASLQMVE